MSYKLIMNWNIKPGRDQDYFEFVVREWIPTTSRLGLQTVGAWYSVYTRNPGEPRIMAEALMDEMSTMRGVLESDEWRDIMTRLLDYVEQYSQKVVETDGSFQL
jgi:hypothetical protein